VQVHASRSVCHHVDDPTLYGRLVLGTTRHRQALLYVEGNMNLVQLAAPPEDQTVIGTASIVEYLREQVAEE
jgi:hypothetical protein